METWFESTTPSKFHSRKRTTVCGRIHMEHYHTTECSCIKSWILLLDEYEHLIGRDYKTRDGSIVTFTGFLWTNEDIYFVFNADDQDTQYASCVARPETSGYTLID